jgi:hypothetical protein
MAFFIKKKLARPPEALSEDRPLNFDKISTQNKIF